MKNTLKFLKNGIFAAIILMVFVGCENENIDSANQEGSNFDKEVQDIATKYNFKIIKRHDDESIYKVADVKELKIILEKINKPLLTESQ